MRMGHSVLWNRKKTEIVRTFMTKGVLTIEKDKTILYAAKLMSELNIGSLLVTEKDVPMGIITERDILSKVVAKELRPESIRVSKVMSAPLVTVEAKMAKLTRALNVIVSNSMLYP